MIVYDLIIASVSSGGLQNVVVWLYIGIVNQAHFKGRQVERQIPDEPLKQFHVKSTDIQISTMICQVSAEFTGAGIAEFHTPALSPRSPPLSRHWVLLGSRGWWETSVKFAVCVWMVEYTHQIKNFVFMLGFFLFLRHLLCNIRWAHSFFTKQTSRWNKCRCNRQTVSVVELLKG